MFAVPVETAPAALARKATVTIRDIDFSRPTVRVARGGRVTWVWDDGPTQHDVTFARFHSATKRTGTYTRRFIAAGTVRYRCTIHFTMVGRVVVG